MKWNFSARVSGVCKLQAWLGVAGGLMLLAGCSHTPVEESYGRLLGSAYAPQPPPFLRGSMALLLTNNSGFTARVVMAPGSLSAYPDGVTGTLMARDGKLLFAPAPDKKSKKVKKSEQGGFLFVWDVAKGNGFFVSDALQAYAPISSSLVFTNVMVRSSQVAPEKAEGYRCQPQETVVYGNDGSAAAYRSWNAPKLHNLPVRIATMKELNVLSISLEKIRMTPPPEELFHPPEGFSHYDSAEAIMTELALRRHSVSGSIPGAWGNHEAPPEAPAPPRY